MIKNLLLGVPVIGPIIKIVPDFVWQGLAIFAVLGSVYAAGDIRGAHRMKLKCEAAAAEARQHAATQDASANAITNQNDTSVTSDLITQDAADKQAQNAVDKAIEDYKRAHPPAKGDVPCRSTLSGDDVKRLRN